MSTTIKIKTYNNKTRKGQYVYIKEKGYPSRQYKYTKGKTNIKALKEYYQQKYVENNPLATLKQKTNIKLHKTSIKELKQIKAPPISELLKKGTAVAVIQNIRGTNQSTINQAKRRLISKLINKPEYLSLMIKQENLTKIKHRLVYDIEYKSHQNKTLITAKAYDKTPEEIIQKLNKSTDSTTRHAIDGGYDDDIIRKYLKANKFQNVQGHNNGTVNKIKLTITIIKNK